LRRAGPCPERRSGAIIDSPTVAIGRQPVDFLTAIRKLLSGPWRSTMRKMPEFASPGATTVAALACGLALWSGVVAAAQTPALRAQGAPAATVQGPAAPATVFRCVTAAGKVQFSDSPCPAGSRGSAWARPAPAQGIVAAKDARPGPASHALLAPPRARALAGPSEPWVDCRQRGGSFDANSRVCKLPSDTVPHMFLAD